MSQSVYTRTIHTITIDVQDDVLAAVETGDQIEIVLMSHNGGTTPMRVSPSNVATLCDGSDPLTTYKKPKARNFI
jgi:hypothetical protein